MTICAQTKKNAVELDSVGDHEGQQYLKISGKASAKYVISLVIIVVLLMGVLWVAWQSWSSVPRTDEARYAVHVYAGNASVTGMKVRLRLLPFLNGSLINGCEGDPSVSVENGYASVDFGEVRPHETRKCVFSVSPFSGRQPAQYTLFQPQAGIHNCIDYSSLIQEHAFERIVVLVSVSQSMGFVSFPTLTESYVGEDGGHAEPIIRDARLDFAVLICILSVALGVLASAEVLRAFSRTRRMGSILLESFPYLTLSIFVLTTSVYLFVGLAAEDGMWGKLPYCVVSEPFLNFLVCSPLNAFSHYTSAHFQGNMFSSLPWEGISLGLLPIGFVAESILRIRRRWIVLTYFAASYLGIVGMRCGLFVAGIGASLSVDGLAGLSLVAAYYGLFSSETVTGNSVRRVILFSTALYVGFAAIWYVGGYLLPIDFEKFVCLIPSPRLSSTVKVDAVAHILSVLVPLVGWAVYSQRKSHALFR
jgi:uncharacterized membrane protein YidH (DUF202 family)